MRIAVQRQDFTDGVDAGSVAGLGEFLSQQRHLRPALDPLFVCEETTSGRRRPQDPEEVGRCGHARDGLGPLGAAKADGPRGHHGPLLDRAAALRPVGRGGHRGDEEPRELGGLHRTFADDHDALRLGIGHRAEQECVHHREDRGVPTDGQGERDHRQTRDHPALSERAQREAQILNQRRHPVLLTSSVLLGYRTNGRYGFFSPVPSAFCRTGRYRTRVGRRGGRTAGAGASASRHAHRAGAVRARPVTDLATLVQAPAVLETVRREAAG